jgi:hypothetical protein
MILRKLATVHCIILLGGLAIGCVGLTPPEKPVVIHKTESNSYEKIGESEKIWLVRSVEKVLVYSNGQQVKSSRQELLLCNGKGGGLPKCKPVRIICGDGSGNCHSFADMMTSAPPSSP